MQWGVQRANDLTVEASYYRYRRHLRSNNGALPISAGALWRMIALEFFEEHGLAGAADTIDQQAGHADSSSHGVQLIKAEQPGVADGIPDPSVTFDGGERGFWAPQQRDGPRAWAPRGAVPRRCS